MDWTSLLGGMGGGGKSGGGGSSGKTTSATSSASAAQISGIGLTAHELVLVAAVFAGALALLGVLWLALRK